MRTTKAYIAGAGTAAVMLAASVALFAMVSGLVAFGGWPSAAAPTRVDQVVLDAIERPTAQPVAVSRTARAVPPSATTKTGRRNGTTRNRLGTQVQRKSGTGTVQAPAAGGTAPDTSSGGGSGGGTTPTATVPQRITDTAAPLLQNAPQPVKDVTNQVNQVIDQVGGTLPGPPPPPAVDKVVGTLK